MKSLQNLAQTQSLSQSEWQDLIKESLTQVTEVSQSRLNGQSAFYNKTCRMTSFPSFIWLIGLHYRVQEFTFWPYLIPIQNSCLLP